MSDPEDYTIGWISALALEYTAAQVQLDEEHDPPKYVHRGDENHYTLGSIGRHKVVLAVLGAGENGVAAAAMVAKDMMHSFSNVKFCVMVGIGGGAPLKEHDIRLGDVVVSMPTFRGQNHGGVVHYDLAATVEARSFRSLHYMNQPPRACLTAVSAIMSKHKRKGNGIHASISGVLAKAPLLRREYGRPEASTDRLYTSDSIPNENSKTDSNNAEIRANRLIQREARLETEDSPAVHYGLIASADGFMEDAKIRDILAGELGVLCFEMEAAGLINQFPCLVIRGICDYSDAHWSKGWRGYAAMSAATYAKDLITEILPYQLEREVGIGKLLDKS